MSEQGNLGTGNRLAIVALIVGEASGVFAGFCPSWFTVSSPFFHEQDAKAGNVKRIRWGEAAATAIVLSTGGAMSYISKDPVPLAASLIITGVFVAGYEYMIAHPSSEDQAETDKTKIDSVEAADESVLYAFKEAIIGAGLSLAA